MSSKLINYAEIIRAKYLFEIDKSFNYTDFLKCKFKNDQNTTKKLCSNIYKKIK